MLFCLSCACSLSLASRRPPPLCVGTAGATASRPGPAVSLALLGDVWGGGGRRADQLFSLFFLKMVVFWGSFSLFVSFVLERRPFAELGARESVACVARGIGVVSGCCGREGAGGERERARQEEGSKRAVFSLLRRTPHLLSLFPKSPSQHHNQHHTQASPPVSRKNAPPWRPQHDPKTNSVSLGVPKVRL